MQQYTIYTMTGNNIQIEAESIMLDNGVAIFINGGKTVAAFALSQVIGVYRDDVVKQRSSNLM